MKTHRIRRLPVVGFGDTLVGILSLNDIVRAAGDAGVRARGDRRRCRRSGAHHPRAPRRRGVTMRSQPAVGLVGIS